MKVLIEDKVAKAVDDQLAVVPLDSLQNMWVVTNHHVGTGVNRCPRGDTQTRAWRPDQLETGMELDDDNVGTLGLESGDLGPHCIRFILTCSAVPTTGDPILQFRIRAGSRERRPQFVDALIGQRGLDC